MIEETDVQEVMRWGRTAGFMIALSILLLVGGMLTGRTSSMLVLSIYFAVLALRIGIGLGIALKADCDLPST